MPPRCRVPPATLLLWLQRTRRLSLEDFEARISGLVGRRALVGNLTELRRCGIVRRFRRHERRLGRPSYWFRLTDLGGEVLAEAARWKGRVRLGFKDLRTLAGWCRKAPPQGSLSSDRARSGEVQDYLGPTRRNW